MGHSFAAIVSTGPLVLAIAVAALAGLVSILSPCVLPLVPGYLSYVTGLAGADLDATTTDPAQPNPAQPKPAQPETAEPDASDASVGASAGGGVAVAVRSPAALRGRVLAGTSLFVLGFAVVFMLVATLVANIGLVLQRHQATLNLIGGALIIVLGLAYLGWIPGLQREARISKLPAAGLLGAPVFGALFALSWIPCTGPTLGAVLILATTSGQTSRAIVLALAYTLGLGVPFVLFGVFFRKLIGVFRAVRRNSRWVTRIGGALLILVGITLVSGGWNHFLVWLQTTFDFGAGTLL